MSDDLLLAERWSRSGDAEAFTALVQRHAGMVYGTCRRIVRDHHAAEDIAQECLLEFARKAGSVRNSVAGTWSSFKARCRRGVMAVVWASF